jgi:hypothetical protein
MAVDSVSIPNRSAWWTRSATFALQSSCLLGRQFVFARQLEDCGAMPRSGHVPGQEFPAFSTTQNEHFKAFRLGHVKFFVIRDGSSAASEQASCSRFPMLARQ